MAKALAILTAWNESGGGDLSLVEQTTMAYLDNQPGADARVTEAINLIPGLVSPGGRMLLQLAPSMEVSEDELLRTWASASPTEPDRTSWPLTRVEVYVDEQDRPLPPWEGSSNH